MCNNWNLNPSAIEVLNISAFLYHCYNGSMFCIYIYICTFHLVQLARTVSGRCDGQTAELCRCLVIMYFVSLVQVTPAHAQHSKHVYILDVSTQQPVQGVGCWTNFCSGRFIVCSMKLTPARDRPN